MRTVPSTLANPLAISEVPAIQIGPDRRVTPDWRAKSLASQRLSHYHRRIALTAERRSVQVDAAADVLQKDLAHLNKRCAVLERALHEALETLGELRGAPGPQPTSNGRGSERIRPARVYRAGSRAR